MTTTLEVSMTDQGTKVAPVAKTAVAPHPLVAARASRFGIVIAPHQNDQMKQMMANGATTFDLFAHFARPFLERGDCFYGWYLFSDPNAGMNRKWSDAWHCGELTYRSNLAILHECRRAAIKCGFYMPQAQGDELTQARVVQGSPGHPFNKPEWEGATITIDMGIGHCRRVPQAVGLRSALEARGLELEPGWDKNITEDHRYGVLMTSDEYERTDAAGGANWIWPLPQGAEMTPTSPGITVQHHAAFSQAGTPGERRERVRASMRSHWAACSARRWDALFAGDLLANHGISKAEIVGG